MNEASPMLWWEQLSTPPVSEQLTDPRKLIRAKPRMTTILGTNETNFSTLRHVAERVNWKSIFYVSPVYHALNTDPPSPVKQNSKYFVFFYGNLHFTFWGMISSGVSGCLLGISDWKQGIKYKHIRKEKHKEHHKNKIFLRIVWNTEDVLKEN